MYCITCKLRPTHSGLCCLQLQQQRERGTGDGEEAEEGTETLRDLFSYSRYSLPLWSIALRESYRLAGR